MSDRREENRRIMVREGMWTFSESSGKKGNYCTVLIETDEKSPRLSIVNLNYYTFRNQKKMINQESE